MRFNGYTQEYVGDYALSTYMMKLFSYGLGRYNCAPESATICLLDFMIRDWEGIDGIQTEASEKQNQCISTYEWEYQGEQVQWDNCSMGSGGAGSARIATRQQMI